MNELHDQVADKKYYMIAFTLRSGSNLLCDYLSVNGAGVPTEYFQYPYGIANRGHYDQLSVPLDDFKSYLARLLAQRSQNNFFGVKLTWDQKNVLREELHRHFGAV